MRYIQLCIVKNIGGYTLETRSRRHRAASAEGARIEVVVVVDLSY